MLGREQLTETVHLFHSQARQYADADPTSTLNKCRIIVEMILGQVLFEEKERNPQGMPLDKLITQTQEYLPIQMIAHSRVVQAYGNFGSHFQMGETPSNAAIVSCLAATAELTKWFDPSHLPLDSEPVHVEVEEKIIEEDENIISETIRTLMHKMIQDKEFSHDDTISLREIKEWFSSHDSNHKMSSVTTHVQMMTTNGETRLFHELAKDGSDELFFRIRKGQYRLYNKDVDPEPIKEIEQFSGWENNLLVVNTSRSFDEVKSNMIYLSPNRSGHYKLRRSKFIGLYQNKSISYIAEIVGKVTFRTEKSKGFVWWNNIGENENDLIQLAKTRVENCDRSDWDEEFPVQAIIFKNLVPVNFTTTKPMQNNNRIFPTKDASNISQLVQMVDGLTWDEWFEHELSIRK